MSWQDTLHDVFPDAVPVETFAGRLRDTLSEVGLEPRTALLGIATCRDELTAATKRLLGAYWGEQFDLGGLGGYPSAGTSGFGAYRAHVPDGGQLLVLHAAHIGVHVSGELGRVQRATMDAATPACGALASYLRKLQRDPGYTPSLELGDVEQGALELTLHPHAEQILAAEHPLKAMTERLETEIGKRIDGILGSFEHGGPVALVGGILIHTPMGQADYFTVRSAVLANADGDPDRTIDLLLDLIL